MVSSLQEVWVGLATALGAGLLIGIERERRKGVGPKRAFAGVRTFAITSVAGATAGLVALDWISASAMLALGALVGVARFRDRSADPGITTEVALLACFLIGMLCISAPEFAAGIATLIAVLLYSRTAIQHFATTLLSEKEMADGIALAALALLLLPLTPNRSLHESFSINPYRVVQLVVVMSAIQAFGHIMLRSVGAKLGTPITGLISGFVSSTATHAAMGARAREKPATATACLSAAALSSVATAVQAAVLTATVAPRFLPVVAPYLVAMGATALVAGALAFRKISDTLALDVSRRAFSLQQAALFALLLTTAGAMVAVAQRTWGETAAQVSIALSALVDVHVALFALLTTAGVSNVSSNEITSTLLVCLTLNALMKLVVSVVAARRSYYSAQITAVLAAIACAPWMVHWLL